MNEPLMPHEAHVVVTNVDLSQLAVAVEDVLAQVSQHVVRYVEYLQVLQVQEELSV